jgi:hypothetical protein
MKNIDDIIKELNNSQIPSLNQLEELRKTLGNRIQRSIIDDLLNASTIDQLDEIKHSNEVWFKEFPKLLENYVTARGRIEFINLLRIQEWATYELN